MNHHIVSRPSHLPRISVVTANYNHGDFLEETMDSVLAQNYPNLEYILIDGGSSDRSVEIIKKHAKHLAYWCSEPDQGHYDAVNKGFRHATGEVMAFLNSDDKYFPDALQTVGEIFTLFPQVRWLTSLRPGVLDFSGRCLSVETRPGINMEAFLDGRYCMNAPFGFIQQESTFWRESLWRESGSRIRSEFTYGGDFALWAQFFRFAELHGVMMPLAGFRVRDGQRNQVGTNYSDECRKILLEARKINGWKPHILRELCLKYRAFEIPKIRGVARKIFGYSANRIVRHLPASPDSSWATQRYIFP